VPAQLGGRQIAEIHPVEPHRTGDRIVEAQQQLKEGRLARAGGPDQRHPLAGLDDQVEAIECGGVRTRRIDETHRIELDAPARRGRQRLRLGRRANLGSDSNNSIRRSLAPAPRSNWPISSLNEPTDPATTTA
jgi:hypothetical protein